jgi:hypothetical protein
MLSCFVSSASDAISEDINGTAPDVCEYISGRNSFIIWQTIVQIQRIIHLHGTQRRFDLIFPVNRISVTVRMALSAHRFLWRALTPQYLINWLRFLISSTKRRALNVPLSPNNLLRPLHVQGRVSRNYALLVESLMH